MKTILCASILCLTAFVMAAAPAVEPEPKPAPEGEATSRADRELAVILLTEQKTRPAIKALRAEVDRAVQAWKQADALLHAKVIPPGFERPTPGEVERLLQALREKRESLWKLYREHLALYEQFLSANPYHWEGYHKYAWFCADHQAPLKAAEAWRRTIELNPGFAFPYNNLATLYNHLGRDMESVDLYFKAILLKGDEPEFHFNLANVLAMHRFDAAHKFGWSLPRLFGECMEHYRAARDLDPESYEYAEAVATQYVMAEHFKVEDWADDAIKDWQFCLNVAQSKHQKARIYMSLGRIYLREKNDPATARQMLLKGQAFSDNPSIRTLLKEAEDRLSGKPRKAPSAPVGREPATI